jgi:class 3 adenylate cyclase
MDYKSRDDYAIWIADPLGVSSQVVIPYFDSVYYNRFNEAKEKGENFFATNLSFEEKNKFYQELFKYVPGLPEESKQFYFNCPGLAISTVLLENVCLYIENFSGTPYTDEQNAMLMRFGKVFQQTYTRFLDLQKAEAQAREAQIELALERVRAKAMAMQGSADVNDAVSIVFEELEKLKLGTLRCGIGILKRESRMADVWTTSLTEQGITLQTFGDESVDIHPLLQGAYDAWLKQEEFNYELKGDDLVRYYRALVNTNFKLPQAEDIARQAETQPMRQLYFVSPFESGNLFAFNDVEFSDEAKKVIRRFASVFNLTYKRYLDLLKAEAQAREAQIEASLERVRSHAMAMHESAHLSEAASALFTELNKLGINPIRTGFVLLTKESRRAKLYPATMLDNRKTVSYTGEFEFIGHPVFEKQYESWQKKENYFPVLEGETLTSYYRILSEALSVSFDQFTKTDKQHGCFLPFSEGFLFTWSAEPYSKTEISILDRFKSILDLTIRRYLDLQRAEEQTRKAILEEKNLREEKKRSDALLLNILPEEIANELKQFGKSYARKHEEVTILFADIKGFSSIAETLSAQELVTQLDECFRAFDHIVDKHGLEKIKTVGDAYVAACGLPLPVADHAAKAVRAAIDMMNFINGFSVTRTIQDLPAFEFRIGIHTGPVITGVVGLKKFTYDIWGDAVNLAARMEQHGEAGKINISESTYALVKDKFTCVPRGKIAAKNKGEVEMYFVEAYSSL